MAKVKKSRYPFKRINDKCVLIDESVNSFLKVKIVNSEDGDEFYGSLYSDGVFSPGAYKHIVDKIAEYRNFGCCITVIVNADVVEGNLF